MNFLLNLLGVFICTLFLVLASPAKADLLSENIETLTDDEWDHYPCVTASGYCIIGGWEYYGVSIP